ncbi:hypothetical protein BCON_0016g00310 [Botryotinia convoluta]|uniref:Uncharacterized protein n=1 Tax=Botryotinia convoluta TaxID=54673 RepID=A0A4Z1INA2_9HELO|nr:hypothetical protein BCON_0016g00310 [Botryotinia convoluta]
MPNLETSQSIGLETPAISFGAPSRSSSPESDTSSPPLSSGSFKRSLKSRIVPPTLVGISEVAMQKSVKMAPTMKVMGKGNGLELTTFTQYEAVPQLVDTSVPAKEFEIDTTETNEQPILMVKRSASVGSQSAPGKRPKVKTYRPSKSLRYKEGRKFKQIENENDGMFEDAFVESRTYTETYSDFNTAPSTPTKRLSATEKFDMDGSHDTKPEFPTGTTIQDFGALPDHLRGPCLEVSPRTSVLDGPSAVPNVDKLLSMNKHDTSLESSLMRPLEAVPEGSIAASPLPEVPTEVLEDIIGQSDGPAQVPSIEAIEPNVGGDSPIPELPVAPIAKDKKDEKRTHKVINKFRSGVRKGRYRCLRTPVLVVMLGKELSKPTKVAIQNIANGLPSGLGDVNPLPA